MDAEVEDKSLPTLSKGTEGELVSRRPDTAYHTVKDGSACAGPLCVVRVSEECSPEVFGYQE